MDKHDYFAANLKAIREARGLSLAEFSNELGIPRSTLQAILADGQTSLYTTVRISERLNVPLDALVGQTFPPGKLPLIQGFLTGLGWFNTLGPDEQDRVIFHLNALLEILRK